MIKCRNSLNFYAWAEVKAEELDEKEFTKAKKLVKGTKKRLILLIGVPEFKTYEILSEEGINDEVVLSNYHKYPQQEGIFFSFPDDSEFQDGRFEDAQVAANVAKSKRFEHGDREL